MEYSYSSMLYHYGVKGMHWGIRRNRNSGGSPKKSRKRKRINSYKTLRTFKAVTTVAGLTGAAFVVGYLGTPAVAKAAVAGAKAVKKARDSYYNTTIFNADGTVAGRYRQDIKVGEAAVNALMRVG